MPVLRESEPPAPTAVGEQAGRRIGWRPIALGLYATAFVLVSAVAGIPAGRDWLILWVLGALVIASIGQPRGAGRLIFDFLPLVAVLIAYDFLKGRTRGITGFVHTYPQLRFDEFLFGGTVPTVTLQRWFHPTAALHLWDYVMALVYLSYFFVPLVVAALVWRFAHQWFARYALMLALIAAAALVTYALFPATPPWLAARHHHLQHVDRIVHGLAGQLHIKLGRAVGPRSSLVNPIAAVPSLHFAVTTSLLLFFWPLTRRWRWLLVAYPIAMGLALVYLGEHYVFDLFIGAIYAVVAYVVAGKIVEGWRARGARAERRTAEA